MRKNKAIKTIISTLSAAICFCAVFSVCINAGIYNMTKNLILSDEELKEREFDCILILGAGVKDDGTPSDMLADRLKRGIKLYFAGCSDKIIMSGDHGRQGYDEVNVMKQYAIDAGVPSDAIFMDHAGFNTYDSVVRAKEIFCAKSVLIVTQRYHLYRALYIAEAVGLTACGSDAAYCTYRGQTYRDIREAAARVKDSFNVFFGAKPTYLGELIPVSGSGDATNDK